MNFDKEAMTLLAWGTTIPVMYIEGDVWFRANDCASVLAYKDPKRATSIQNGNNPWRCY